MINKIISFFISLFKFSDGQEPIESPAQPDNESSDKKKMINKINKTKKTQQ